jgi:hypothetical protein
MSRAAESEMQRWTIASAVAVVGTALVVALFRAPENAPASAGAPAPLPPVLVRADNGIDVAFDEQKILADPTPLFLPTKWNAGRRGVARPEPGATFENYPPSYLATGVEGGLKLDFPSPVAIAATPVEALADSPGPLLVGIGRSPATWPPLSERGAFVEIVADGTGQAVLRQALLDARPPGGGAWQPLEFLAHVNTMGLVGTLALTRRSGVEGVDDYFQRYLVQTLRVGQRLAPGFYRISVGP